MYLFYLDADETSSDESKGKDKTKKIVIKNEITPHFSKSSAKDALLNEVSRKCCYGTTAAKQVSKIERQRERYRERDREKERQRERETERKRDREKERHREREREKERNWEMG